MKKNITIRKKPEQQRSKQTVDTILTCASKLIGEQGMDSISMTQIAKEAQMSKAALYRYFPNMQSLLRALAERSFEQNSISLENLLSSDLPVDSLIKNGVTNYCKEHRDNPFLVSLRAAIHSDPVLAKLDQMDSQKNADQLKLFLKVKYPAISEQKAMNQSLLFVELIGSLARLCSQFDLIDSDEVEREFTSLFVNAWQNIN